MLADGWLVVIYMGCATLDDGARRETVHVTLQGSREMVTAHPFGAQSANSGCSAPSGWGGRIVASFDWCHWGGNLVTITLPTGGRGYVVVQVSGALMGVGDNPFDC